MGVGAVFGTVFSTLTYRGGASEALTPPQKSRGKSSGPYFVASPHDIGRQCGARLVRVDASYDVLPDGRGFVMLQSGAVPREINVVQNFFEELRQVVPE